jgi:hypothetical protein
MDEALEILASERQVLRRPTPRLRLLLEREPAHHVFFSNLLEALHFRRPPPLDLTQPPMDFWRNVFLPSELPWKSFQESLLWHLVAAIVAWGISQGWVSRPQPHVREATFRAAEALYYAPPKSAPAARSGPTKVKQPVKAEARAAASPDAGRG